MDPISADVAGWQPSFEGMDLERLAGGAGSAIETSAIRTIRALDELQLLDARHALTCQLIVELARAVGRGLTYGKVSVATATLAKQLLDAIDSLPKPPERDDSDSARFDELVRQLAQL